MGGPEDALGWASLAVFADMAADAQLRTSAQPR